MKGMKGLLGKAKGIGLGKATKQLASNLTHLAYCIYLSGYEAGKVKNKKLGFREFCASIKDLHKQGGLLWTNP